MIDVPMMRKALIALTLVLVSGCVTGDIIGSKTSTGTYVLKSVNGSALPFTLSTNGNVKTELVDETMYLYEGFTFFDKVHRRITTGTVVTTDSTTDSGNWGASNNSMGFRFNSDPSINVLSIVENKTVTMSLPGGRTKVFKKQ
jgi:hypothetical protein